MAKPIILGMELRSGALKALQRADPAAKVAAVRALGGIAAIAIRRSHNPHAGLVLQMVGVQMRHASGANKRHRDQV